MTTFTTPSDLEVAATHTFDAPRALVWDAYTKPEHVPNWMLGAAEWSMPVCEIDLRPGGKWRFVWRKANGTEMEMEGVYREVLPPERLVSTERWGPAWPETINTLILTEANGRTILTCTVLYPSKEDRDKAMGTGMKDGWEQSLGLLQQYLATPARS